MGSSAFAIPDSACALASVAAFSLAVRSARCLSSLSLLSASAFLADSKLSWAVFISASVKTLNSFSVKTQFNGGSILVLSNLSIGLVGSYFGFATGICMGDLKTPIKQAVLVLTPAMG